MLKNTKGKNGFYGKAEALVASAMRSFLIKRFQDCLSNIGYLYYDSILSKSMQVFLCFLLIESLC